LKELRSRYKIWAGGVRTFVSTYVYQVLQFVSDPTDIAYGSEVQKATCAHLGVPDEMAEDFWNEEGGQNLENAIRRKRSTLYNGLNTAFKKYCGKQEANEGDDEKVMPPDPKDFVPAEMLKGTSHLGGCAVCLLFVY
jgi:hypothetical protein